MLNKTEFQSTEAWDIVFDMFMCAAGDFFGFVHVWIPFYPSKTRFLPCFGYKIPKFSGLRPHFAKGGPFDYLRIPPLRKYLGHLRGVFLARGVLLTGISLMSIMFGKNQILSDVYHSIHAVTDAS